MSQHRQHPYPTRRPSRALEVFLDYALAVAIAAGLAWLLVAWWSS
jgi:hypothetical protein